MSRIPGYAVLFRVLTADEDNPEVYVECGTAMEALEAVKEVFRLGEIAILKVEILPKARVLVRWPETKE